MKLNKSDIKRILLITLSNIGDIILTTPIISALDKDFPGARIDILVGPLGREIFAEHPRIFKVIVYDKHIPLQNKRRLIQKLKRIRYDMVIDLKNSLLPMLIGSRYRTSPIQSVPKDIIHKKYAHLYKLRQLGIEAGDAPFFIHIAEKDKDHIDTLLKNIPADKRLVIVSPTSKSLIKRWIKQGFAQVSDRLVNELKASVVMVGSSHDHEAIDEITGHMKEKAINLAGRTTMPQLAYLIKRSNLLITNDSAAMHAASAVGTKALAIFGPTDPRKYGPLGKDNRVIRKNLDCSPCEVARCNFKHECMNLIAPDEVYEHAEEMLR